MNSKEIVAHIHCPLCGALGEVTIESDGEGPRYVVIERMCEHLDEEYEEMEEGIYVYFNDESGGGDHVFVPAP